MKAIVVYQYGSPETLEFCNIPVPEPHPHEVLVQNHFIGVNFVDTQHRAGQYYVVPLPLIPGTEAAGMVATIGSEVTDFQVGDRVAYAGYMGGNYAEYTCVPQGRLVSVPDTISLEQAAACLLQGLTAYVFTHRVFALKAGDTALIHAAAGGVGLLLVQMAKQLGATVIGTTSSEQKALIARQAGVDHIIIYTQADFVDATMQFTNQQGVSVVYDGVGGTAFEKNLDVLQSCGYLVLFGQANGQPAPLDISRLSGITGSKNRGSLFVTWASSNDYLTTTEQLRTCAQAVFSAIQHDQLHLHITSVFPLEQARQAHILLESRATTGKLLLQVKGKEPERVHYS